jgi:DNA invertase Pin-like site-specific DNA recombinase
MSEGSKIRAAQYLRMSTEHQRYSLTNQNQAIASYAEARGYDVNRTYFDPGKSGLTLKERKGLQALLGAALQRDREFDAILVLDVSRWGRFQDVDQSAHYEFICREAGLQVVYCAEAFENDGSAMSALVKQMKRVMAAEYSRELSGKISRGKHTAAELGFHPGGAAPYGFRRMVIDASGRTRGLLGPGERKCQVSERVILVPGPSEELAVIRQIFQAYVVARKGMTRIASELNAAHVAAPGGGEWTAQRVRSVLKNELAIGVRVFNRSQRRLTTDKRRLPAHEWRRVKVTAPVVSQEMFRRAAARIGANDRGRPRPAKLLAGLRRLLQSKGYLSPALIQACKYTGSVYAYYIAFGSLRNAYAQIGYDPRRWGSPAEPGANERLLALLKGAYERHGYLNMHVVDADTTLPSVHQLKDWFGSLSHAYELAGLPHTKRELHVAAIKRRIAAGNGPVGRPRRPSDETMLEGLKRLFAQDGYVCARTIDTDPGLPAASRYQFRFGSLLNAYQRAGLPHDMHAIHQAAAVRREAKRQEALLVTRANSTSS